MHRLDKDTTGLMVVAKNDSAHKGWRRSSQAMAATEAPFERGYLAFVWGAPDRPRGTIDRPIDRHKIARDRMAIREGGREAVTHWEVLERYGGQKGDRQREGGRPGQPSPACWLAGWKPAGPIKSGSIWPRSAIP